jgi:hypothetical protein
MAHLRLVFLTLVALALAGVVLAPIDGASAASKGSRSRADLVVSGLSAPRTVVTGSTLTVKVAVTDRGRGRASASTTRVSLGTVRTVVRTKALRSSRSARTSVRLRAPKPGRYLLTACADARKQVKERSESNNCRSIAVVVSARPATVPPTPTPPTPPPAGLLATPSPLDVTPTAGPGGTTLRFDPGVAATSSPLALSPSVSAYVSLPETTFLEGLSVAITPTTLTGAPFTEVLGALRVTPDVLAERAYAVTFTFPGTAPGLGTLVAFTADADGTDLRLAPVDPYLSGSDVKVMVDHTGIIGLAVATPAQTAALAARWPREADQQLEAAFASPLIVGLRAVRSGAGAGWQAKALAASAAADSAIVAPALRGAGADAVGQGVAATRLGFGWLGLTALAVDDDDSLFPDRFDAVDADTKAVVLAMGEAAPGYCTSHGGTSAIPFVVGAARRLRLIDESTRAAQTMTGSGLGIDCAYLLSRVQQSWTYDSSSSTAGLSSAAHDAGDLLSDYGAGTWGADGWSNDVVLSWQSYAGSSSSSGPGFSSSTTRTAAQGTHAGLRLGRYGLTRLRDGGALPMTLVVRMYAVNGDPAGTVHAPTVSTTTVSSIPGLPTSTSQSVEAAPHLPLDDPQATGASGGPGGEFDLTGSYALTHDFTLTTESPTSGGTTTQTQTFSLRLQPT